MSARAARGFTLVELMISLALGSLLALVVAQLFANTRTSNRAAEDASRVQESMRFAADVIGRTVRISGYKSDPLADVYATAGRALDGVNGAGALPDELIVRFQGAGPVTGTADNTILNCLGVPVAPNFTGTLAGISYNHFRIAPGADGRNALFCSTDPAVNPGTELVPGVEAMQILFGEDMPAPNPLDGTADRYVVAGSVTQLDNVVAVRVYLMIAGKEGVRVDDSATNYTLAGQAYTFEDRILRRVVTQTIVLRNRAP